MVVESSAAEHLIEQFAQGWKQPDPHAWDHLLTPDVQLRQPLLPDRRGREALAEEYGRLTVTWHLEAEGNGTRLFLEHDGFDPDDPVQQRARGGMGSGWRSHVLCRLAEVLHGRAGRSPGQEVVPEHAPKCSF